MKACASALSVRQILHDFYIPISTPSTLHFNNANINSNQIGSDHHSKSTFLVDAVVLLNSPTNMEYELDMWAFLKTKAKHSICADGAFTQLLEKHSARKGKRDPSGEGGGDLSAIMPDFVCGDFDSLKEKALAAQSWCFVNKTDLALRKSEILQKEVHEEQQCDSAGKKLSKTTSGGKIEEKMNNNKLPKFIQITDQDNTDFDKCVDLFTQVLQPSSQPAMAPGQAFSDTSNSVVSRLVVLGGFGGRFDHELAALNTLVCHPNLHITMHNIFNTLFVVPPGTRAEFQRNKLHESTCCGVVPIGLGIGLPKHIATTGLEWNLGGNEVGPNVKLGFGGLLSTSNRITKDEITIEVSADSPVSALFTVGMEKQNR